MLISKLIGEMNMDVIRVELQDYLRWQDFLLHVFYAAKHHYGKNENMTCKVSLNYSLKYSVMRRYNRWSLFGTHND